MLDEKIDLEEKVMIVDHFSQQLINSGYSEEKTREIVLSGLKVVQRKENRRKERIQRYRGSHETIEDRLHKKAP